MTAYSEFRIRIEPGSRKGLYRVEATGVAGNQTGAFRVPFRDEGLENFVLKVGQTRRGVRSLESPQFDLAKEFGGKLFTAVMQGPVGELYRASYSTARAQGQGTRVTLSLTDVPELGEIPWEYMFDPPNFLAISKSTPVVRYLDVAQPQRPLEVGLPIRILGVVSAPTDYEVLDAEAEKARLASALKPLIDANAVSIEWLETASLTALTKKLQPDTFHILHFIGHGGFDKSSGKGALLFEDETGRGRAISGEQLATILHDKQSLRLVFLNSCEGARTSIKDPFSGVAASLIEREIPAVIAMQFEITDRAAIIFAGEFYARLAEGQPVDASVTEARLLVFADDNDVEWGTPVLFLRVQDGVLFDVADASELPRPTVEDLPPKVIAPVVVAGVGEADGGAGGGEAGGGEAGGGGSETDGGAEAAPPEESSDGGAVPIVGAVLAGGAGAGAGGSDEPDRGASPVPGESDDGPGAGSPPPTGGSGDGVSGSGPDSGSGSGDGGSGAGGSGSGAGDDSSAGGSGAGGSGGGGSGSGGSGSGGPPVGPVGPTIIEPGPNLRAIGLAALALVAIVAVVFVLGNGRWPWNTPTGSTGQASELPSGSPNTTPTPTPTGPTTPQPSSQPPETPPPTPPPPIKIAVQVVDRDTTNSRGIIDGVRFAVKEAHGEVNGVPVTVPASVVFDDHGSTDTGKEIIAKVIDDEDVVALVGPYNSSVAIGQIPLSNEAGLLQCSPSATSEGLTRPEAGAVNLRPSRPDAINFVRTVTTNELDPIGAAMYLLGVLDKQAVYIVDNGAASAVTRADRFGSYWESVGARVVGRRSIPSRVTDYSTLVEEAKAFGADVVYFSGSSGASPTAARLLKAMRESGLDVPFMGSGEIFDGTTSNRGSFLNLATDFEGTGVYMTYPAAGDYEDRASFEDRYKEEYGRAPSLYSITAYACTEAILAALARTDLSLDRPAALRDALRANVVDSTITYDSAMGDFRFDENGDTTLQIVTVYDFPTDATDWRPLTYIDVPDQ